jgi:transposase
MQGAFMKTPIPVQREIVRLIDKGLSSRSIGRQLSLSHNTVELLRTRLISIELTYADLSILDDHAFAISLGTARNSNPSRKLIPDWTVVQEELAQRDMTLALIWEEYRQANHERLSDCLSYSQFQKRYRAWQKTQRISMRQFHKPGDMLFVDFCGRTMQITDKDTGEQKPAQVFVGVLGGSSYTFAYAVPTQKIADWIACHVRAFEFFGGVTQQVVPDNLKSAVIKHTPKEVIINAAYADCAEHYDVLINPARSRKPKDKSLAEVGVQIVQRWVLAPLRKRTFFSIEELNEEIGKRVTLLNHKVSKKYKQSRAQRFAEIDQPALRPLPDHPYECVAWKYNVSVTDDYHVEYDGSFYSVPYQYRMHKVDLRATGSTIEVLLNRSRIASHALLATPGRRTLQDHMPIEHLRQSEQDPESLLDWAENIGPNVLAWVNGNLKQRRDFANGVKSARNLRRWAREEQIHDRLDSACAFAIKIGVLSFQRLKSIVTNRSDQRTPVEQTAWVQKHANLRGPDYYMKQGEQAC